jgi:geranylgeranyl pyrophosphate synthase/predicted secreted hydrolase
LGGADSGGDVAEAPHRDGREEPRGRIADAALSIPDLGSHPDFPVEWWFCHGRFGGAGVAATRFMVSFFRLTGIGRRRTGPMLLLAMHRDGDAVQRYHSRIGPDLLKVFASRRDTFIRAGMNPHLLDGLIDEATRYGPPQPIVVDERPATIAERPLRIAWGDFRFTQQADGFSLRFAFPNDAGGADGFSLTLTPRTRWLESRDPSRLNDAAYVSCPRLSLAGTVGGRQVAGDAWLDQQWCNAGLFIPDRTRNRLYGLDWMGINLDDGTDLIVQLRRNTASGRRFSPVAVFFEPGREPRVTRTVKMTAGKTWQSPRTRIDYPLHWKVALPDERMSLSFAPDCADQEIPVFGYDAIWEGAGTVVGTHGGRKVSGRARLELDGYGHMLHSDKFLGKLRARVAGHVARKLPRSLPASGLRRFVGRPRWAHSGDFYGPAIAGPAWHLLDVGGKQWRSVFVVMLLEALGVAPGKFEYEAVVMAELIHTATLIVDDIEDNSDGRRNVPSTHRAYGIDVALNAGNALYFLPLQVLAGHPDLTVAQREEMYRLIIDYFVRAHFGQAHDIYLSTDAARRKLRARPTADGGRAILEMYANKTSAQIMALAEMACIVAGADGPRRKSVVDFARSIGVAFQIMDDIRGLRQPPGSLKAPGEDIVLGKLTYLNHSALAALPPRDRKRLAAILAGREARKPATLRESIALIEQSGAIEACSAEAWAMAMRDWRRLSAQVPPSRSKTMLRAMWVELLRA